MAKAKTGLGKGLDALFEDNHIDEKGTATLYISQIEPNKAQPRVDFEEQALRELADSIRVHGILQPLVVRPLDEGNYQIVAGERRWRAARMAGLKEVPVVVKTLNDTQTLEIAIIENLQREDLNPIELALGYEMLMQEYYLTQEQVAEKVGKSRPVVANTIRLLNLPEEVRQMVKKGDISTGHARALLALEDPAAMLQMAQQVVEKGLLVRDIERLAKQQKEHKKPGKKRSVRPGGGWGNHYYKEVELALTEEFGRKVYITEKNGKSTLSIDFYNEEDLQHLVQEFIEQGKR